MPPRDLYHHAVRAALMKDGWMITHDPYIVAAGRKNVYVDLGAERMLAAERGEERIAVEIKTFTGPSEVRDLEHALGQYLLYKTVIEHKDPDRQLVLALSVDAFEAVMESELGRLVRAAYDLKLLVFDPVSETVEQWQK